MGQPPYPYQTRLAMGSEFPTSLRVPTGAGKTAGAVLAWLYRRRFHPDGSVRSATPRRLVYCLPMRVLVEQVRDNVCGYLDRLGLTQAVSVQVLMGGEARDDDWMLYPERDAVIIGTQDMLLSRALNRGYALSRFRWPVPFGLLNNDCLWVFDEVQLMGAAVPTSTQMAAFRSRLGHWGPSHTLWMSATLAPGWLSTVDHPRPAGPHVELGQEERDSPELGRRLGAAKHLEHLQVRSSPKSKGYASELAAKIGRMHQPGTLSLVIANTVTRAQALFEALESASKVELLLIHSRLRPVDRQAKLERLLAPVPPEGPGRIAVSTQVLEAGVDISCALMVSELAPWTSMVQRFGRCNRKGEYRRARICWVDLPRGESAPYRAEELEMARSLLGDLEGCSAAPISLPDPELPREEHEVLRLKDLVELFDTGPDLSGNDVDISRFVRESDQHDARVFWRSWPEGEDPPPDWPRPARDELCAAPLAELREYLSREQAWAWDHLDRRWRRVHRAELWPGQVLALRAEAGGYRPDLGWCPEARGSVASLQPALGEPEEAGGDDHQTIAPGFWQSLADHSNEVVARVQAMVSTLGLDGLAELQEDLVSAARWHDLGKAHPVFQEWLLADLDQGERLSRSAVVWGKSPDAGRRRRRKSRPHFRHELASLLALMEAPIAGSMAPLSDLALYLVASHHGKVRLSIRAFPGSDGHSRRGRPRFLLGLAEGDVLPPVALGDGHELPSTTLGLWPAAMGEHDGARSWQRVALSLRDSAGLGPFRLAYLEALIRAADAQASRDAAMRGWLI